jgi:hypothetical protein
MNILKMQFNDEAVEIKIKNELGGFIKDLENYMRAREQFNEEQHIKEIELRYSK